MDGTRLMIVILTIVTCTVLEPRDNCRTVPKSCKISLEQFSCSPWYKTSFWQLWQTLDFRLYRKLSSFVIFNWTPYTIIYYYKFWYWATCWIKKKVCTKCESINHTTFSPKIRVLIPVMHDRKRLVEMDRSIFDRP